MELNGRADTIVRGFPYKNILVICTLVLALAVAGRGQTTGQPLTETSGGTALPSPLVLDATRFNGSPDVCLQINAAIVQMNSTATNNGVVDARGFTGSLQCASNMFPSNATGKLLLGNVVLHVSKTQVQPSLFQVEGTGWGIAGTPSNTIVRACTSSDSTSVCPSGALSGSPPVVWCWGQGGSCSGTGHMGI
jgi:hypothetical protein